MDFLKKCCNCYFCSYKACGVAMCIDTWHAYEACSLAYLFQDACCWTLFAPICIDCKLGQFDKSMQNCVKCAKYCLFACVLGCAGCVDGLYNCFMVTSQVCGENKLVTSYAELTKHSEFIANKVKQALGLECGNQPLKSMGTFTP